MFSMQVLLPTIGLLLFKLESNCIPNKSCNRIQIGDLWYEKDYLWVMIGRPYNLNIHKTTNNLFFSFSQPETYEDVDFQLGFYNMDSKESQIIAGIKGGCAVAIDHVNDEIYLGGSDGIYQYNTMTKLADFYAEKGKNIWSLFYRKNLFYINYPDQKLHIRIDGKFVKVREFENIEVDHFHVSSNNDIFYANKSGLFKIDNAKMHVSCLTELIAVRQISEDIEGNVYFCTNTGVFVDNRYEGLKKMLEAKNIFGLAFDKDNAMVMSDDKSIYKLVQTEVGCENKIEKHW